jgi:hypothetical protein
LKNVLRFIVYGFLLLLVVAIFLPLLGSGLQLLGLLLFGWIGFLRRVIPQVTVSWSGIGMVLACSALIVGGMHWLCAWIQTARQTKDSPITKRWRWSWTLSIYFALWLLFLTAMAATGFVHQAVWLMASKEPLMVQRRHRSATRIELSQTARQVLNSAVDADWNLAMTRQEFFANTGRTPFRGKLLAEEFDVLFIPGLQDKLAGAVVFHRDPVERQKTGFIVVPNQSNNVEEPRAMVELSNALARLNSAGTKLQ